MQLTTRADYRDELLGDVVVEVIEAVGRTSSSDDDDASEQREALLSLLQHAVAAGGRLQKVVNQVACQHAANLGAQWESMGPAVLCGTRSLREFITLLEPPPPSTPGISLLKSCALVLSTNADQKERLRAVKCCTLLWDAAVAKWPEELAASTASPAGEDAMDLAAALVNTIVRTSLYDPIGKLRGAAMAAVLPLVPALKPQEVLKLASLKVRDKDKDARRHAMRVMAALVPADDGDLSRESGGGLGLGSALTTSQLQALVLHGVDGPAASKQSHELARASFWGHLIQNQERLGEVLAELRVLQQREL